MRLVGLPMWPWETAASRGVCRICLIWGFAKQNKGLATDGGHSFINIDNSLMMMLSYPINPAPLMLFYVISSPFYHGSCAETTQFSLCSLKSVSVEILVFVSSPCSCTRFASDPVRVGLLTEHCPSSVDPVCPSRHGMHFGHPEGLLKGAAHRLPVRLPRASLSRLARSGTSR